MKELTLKACKRCGAVWFGGVQSVTMVAGDQIDLVTMKVTYCEICKQSYDKEINAPTYHRVPRTPRR